MPAKINFKTILLLFYLTIAIGCKKSLDIGTEDYMAIQQKIMVALIRCDQAISDEIKSAYIINPDGLNQDILAFFNKSDSLITSIFDDIEALLEIENRKKAKINEIRSRLIRNSDLLFSILCQQPLGYHAYSEHISKVNYLLSKRNLSPQEIRSLAFHYNYLHYRINSQIHRLISKDIQSHYIFTPIVIPERNILKPGQKFRAKIALAIIDTMHVNDFALVGNDSLALSNGKAIYSKSDFSKGKHHLKGQINASQKQNADYSTRNYFQLTITAE